MLSVRWQGRDIGPTALIEAAREARRHTWLEQDDRRFLHGAGLSLAAGRPLGAPELLRLDLVLGALRRLGWGRTASLLESEAGLIRTPAPADEAELAELEAEVGRVALMLAVANERLEACQHRLEQRRRALPEDTDFPW